MDNKTNEELFKQALIDSVEAGIQVKIDETGSRKNEITILTIAYCFPLRTLRDLRFREERYLEAINNPNTGRENRTVLHTEGTGEQFPNAVSILLALALGFVAYGLSIMFYIYAQRELGAAKTSAYYAIAPFIGVALSLIIFTELPSVSFVVALLIMIAGTYVVTVADNN